MALVLRRKKEEALTIRTPQGEKIKIVSIDGTCRLAITAPIGYDILRDDAKHTSKEKGIA